MPPESTNVATPDHDSAETLEKHETTMATEDRDPDFESAILAKIKPFGKFQIRVVVWGILIDIPVAMNIMFFLFGGANPGYSCVTLQDSLANNYSHGTGSDHPNLYTGISNDDGRRLFRGNVTWRAGLENLMTWPQDVCHVNHTECTFHLFHEESFTSVVSEVRNSLLKSCF